MQECTTLGFSSKTVSIGVKLAAMTVGCAAAAAAMIGVVSYYEAASSQTISIEQSLEAIGEGRKQALGDYLGSIDQDIRVTSESPFVHAAMVEFAQAFQAVHGAPRDMLQDLYINKNPNPLGQKHKLDAASDGSNYSAVHRKYHPWMRTFLEERGYYDIFLFDTQGNLVYTVFKEMDFATNLKSGAWKDTDLGAAFRAASTAQSGTISFFDFRPYAPSADAPAAFIAMPMFAGNGDRIGVLAFQMPIGGMNNIMQQHAGLGETGETYLVGADHLMRSDSRFSEESTILKRTVDGMTAKAAVAGEHGTASVLDYRGTPVISAYTPINFHGTRWAILAEKDVAEAMQPIASMRNQMLLSGLGVLALVAISGFLVSRRFSRPIVDMTNVMQTLAGGDLAIVVPGLDRGDEIGGMAHAVEVFKQNAVERVRLEAEQRAAQAEREQRAQRIETMIATFDQQVGDALGVVASATTEMEATAKTMRQIADATSEQSGAVAAASEQAANNVQMVAGSAEEFGSSIQEITRQVQDSNNFTQGAVEEVDKATREVQLLAEASQRVGDIVGMIADITSQTNLLALNATIEAARAGEAGKGFAVVASEVKTLAAQTAKATEDISAQITAIQQATASAVGSIDGVSGTIKQINDITAGIASAVEEQSAAIAEINRNVQDAAHGAEDVTKNIDGVSQRARETGVAATQVLATSQEVAEQANLLSDQVNAFLRDVRAA